MNSWFGKWVCAISIVLFVFSLSACNEDKRQTTEKSLTDGTTISGKTTKTTETTEQIINDAADMNNTTSIEAVKIAYEEAKKWNSKAVLWYISPSPMFLHYDWNNTDKAMSWTIGFANPDNDEEVLVYIRDGKVKPVGNNTVDNVGNKRKVECKAEYPKDSPKVSMKDAVQVAIANGAPAGVMPVNVAYDIESFGKAGTPLWMIVYNLPLPADPQKNEMHFYYVDGLTGKFVEAGYKADGTIVEKEQLTIKGPDYSASTVLMDQRTTIVKFLTLVNENSTEEAVAMMDKLLIPDESAQKTWKNTLDSIKGFNIEFVTEENKENWSSDMQMFEVDLIVPASKDLQLYGWMEGKNTRYVTLKRLGNNWLIESFSFQ